jgi:arylsulfatase A-like enzyme
MDFRIEQILDAIKEAGVDDNTAVIISSDNGTDGISAQPVGGSSGPWRGDYEQSLLSRAIDKSPLQMGGRRPLTSTDTSGPRTSFRANAGYALPKLTFGRSDARPRDSFRYSGACATVSSHPGARGWPP